MFFAFLIGFYKHYQNLNYTNEIKINGIYAQQEYICQKIAPGTNGKLVISNNKEKIKLYVNENNKKPRNMYFKIESKIFNDIKEAINYINDEKLKYAEIEWIWEYSKDDSLDTIDGVKAENYVVEIYEEEEVTI